MNAMTPTVKTDRTYALLKNMTNLKAAVDGLIDRPPNTEGLGVMYGETGVGKTYSTLFVRNKTNAILIRVGEFTTRKGLLSAILTEGGVAKPKGTTESLANDVIMLLGDDRRRPLIIDEADKLIDKGMIELVRDLYDISRAPVILVGEELLRTKLERVARVYGRVGSWIPAEVCDFEDAKKLVPIFLTYATLTDGLLEHIRCSCDGRPRLIVNTLHRLSSWARNTGTGALDLTNFPKEEIFTGKAPKRGGARLDPGAGQ